MTICSHLRTIAAFTCLLGLTACNAVDTVKEGMAHSTAVSEALEKSLGAKPQVGFNWRNGVLTDVSVVFDGLPQTHTLNEISTQAKLAVTTEFKETPERIVISFSVKP
jgi:hypothetical protein